MVYIIKSQRNCFKQFVTTWVGNYLYVYREGEVELVLRADLVDLDRFFHEGLLQNRFKRQIFFQIISDRMEMSQVRRREALRF